MGSRLLVSNNLETYMLNVHYELTNYDLTRNNPHREKFGVHNVDMEDPARTRTPKGTATFLKKIYEDNGFVQE